jgi:flagellar hook protein FlgE
MAVGSFSSGLAGLSANSTYLSVIGNNLANINTVGFKASTVTFADLVSQTVGGTSINPMQVGLGVATGSISPVFSQGTLENSSKNTHVAIQGKGFFIVRGNDGVAYTRAGAFDFDSTGALVTPDGRKVQGYTQLDPLTNQVITTGQPTDIVIPPGDLRPPVATTSLSAEVNLDANVPIDAANPEYATSVRIYDSKGAPHVVNMVFNRTGPGAWTVDARMSNADLGIVPATGTTSVITGGTPMNLTFDANGNLTAPTADITFTVPAPGYTNGATSPVITWDIIPPAGSGQQPSLTSFNSVSAAGSISQNGSPAGQVSDLAINSSGQVVATFGAGQTVVVGQIALANFNNPSGLVKLGNNLYGESQAAGVANVGTPGTGGRGGVTGNALESSNVDIAQEFTRMILAQRGYQANSRSITTADEIMVETLGLKR